MNRILEELRATNLRLDRMEKKLNKLIGFHRGEKRLIGAAKELGVSTNALRKALKIGRRQTEGTNQDA